MIGSSLFVRTPSRLHFGLLGLGPDSGRQFGGLGLMIEEPAIRLTAMASTSIQVQGPLADRARRILSSLSHRLAESEMRASPVRIHILEAPPEHIGLGVGTQLSLAIAAAVSHLCGGPPPVAEELARLAGRGRRSGIGLHGFWRGGLLVNGGRKPDGDVPPLIARLDFPADWSVLTVQAPGHHGLHGPDEIRAFKSLPPMSPCLTDRLCRIVLRDILPSVVECDLDGFGAALEDLQARVGASFSTAQGGPYSSPLAIEIIEEMHGAGFVGCGQSSWGPTLYGFTDRPRDEARGLAERLRGRLGLEPSAVTITRAANGGATIEERAADHDPG